MWIDGDSLYQNSSMHNVWDMRDGAELFITLGENGVGFSREFDKDKYDRVEKQYYILDCDNNRRVHRTEK